MAMAISVPLYTENDLEHFPDDGNRYELLDGVLLVTPQAALVHQVVANRSRYARRKGRAAWCATRFAGASQVSSSSST